MNETAKKLREAAAYMKGEGVISAEAIYKVRDALGVSRSQSLKADLGAVLEIIADEMDALQAKAAEAHNLRQQLDSAEDKAERRKQHIGYLETALHDKNALLEQRGGTIARLTAECSELRKQVPSERERQILDMWPKFEDGEYVWFGDSVEHDGTTETVQGFKLYRCGPAFLSVVGVDTEKWLRIEDYESVKRPVQSVLDADGVEIKVGDTVWFKGKPTEYKVTVVLDGIVYLTYKNRNGDNATATTLTRNLTHTRLDSWEWLEEDVNTIVTGSGMYLRLNDYCNKRDLGGDDVMVLTVCDIVHRAKKLAGVEVGR